MYDCFTRTIDFINLLSTICVSSGKNNLIAYPNPCIDYVKIKDITGNLQFEIFDQKDSRVSIPSITEDGFVSTQEL